MEQQQQQRQQQNEEEQQQEEETESVRRRKQKEEEEEEERIKIQKRQYEHRLMVGLGLPLHPYCPPQQRQSQQQQQQQAQQLLHQTSSPPPPTKKMPIIRILVISDINLQSASRLAEYTLRGGCDDTGRRKLGGGGIDLCCIVGPLHSDSIDDDDDEEEEEEENAFTNYLYNQPNNSNATSNSKPMTKPWLNAPLERQSMVKGLITSTLSQLETIVCRVLYIPGHKDPPQLLIRQQEDEKAHAHLRLTPNSKNVQKQWLNLCHGLGIFGLSECQEVVFNRQLSSSSSSLCSSLDEKENDAEEEDEDSSSFESHRHSLHTSSSSSLSTTSSSFSSFLESLNSDDAFLSALEEEEEEDREITNYLNDAKKILHIAPKHHNPTSSKVPFINSTCQGIFMTHIRPRSQKFIERQHQQEEKVKKKQCKERKRRRRRQRRRRRRSKRSDTKTIQGRLGWTDNEITFEKDTTTTTTLNDECDDDVDPKTAVLNTKVEKKHETNKKSSLYWPKTWPSPYRQLFDSDDFQKNVVLSLTSPPFPVHRRRYSRFHEHDVGSSSCYRGVDPRQGSTLLRQDDDEVVVEQEEREDDLNGGGDSSNKPFKMQRGNVTILNPGSLRVNGDFALVDMVFCSTEDDADDDGGGQEERVKKGDKKGNETRNISSVSSSSYQWKVHHIQFHSLN